MPVKINTESLPVPLTHDELRQRGEKLASLLADRRRIEADLVKAKTATKSKLEQLDAEAMSVEEQIRERSERRPVEVMDLLDVERKVINRVRMDTGEVIYTRPAKFDDLQPELPLAEEGADAEEDAEEDNDVENPESVEAEADVVPFDPAA